MRNADIILLAWLVVGVEIERNHQSIDIFGFQSMQACQEVLRDVLARIDKETIRTNATIAPHCTNRQPSLWRKRSADK